MVSPSSGSAQKTCGSKYRWGGRSWGGAEGQTLQNRWTFGLFRKEIYPQQKRLYMMCTLEVQVNYFVNGVSEKTIDFCKGLSSTCSEDYTCYVFYWFLTSSVCIGMKFRIKLRDSYIISIGFQPFLRISGWGNDQNGQVHQSMCFFGVRKRTSRKSFSVILLLLQRFLAKQLLVGESLSSQVVRCRTRKEKIPPIRFSIPRFCN